MDHAIQKLYLKYQGNPEGGYYPSRLSIDVKNVDPKNKKTFKGAFLWKK